MEFTPITTEQAQAATNDLLCLVRNTVREMRTAEKLSNKKVAELSGVNPASLCQFMKDNESPRPATLDVYMRLQLLILQWKAS